MGDVRPLEAADLAAIPHVHRAAFGPGDHSPEQIDRGYRHVYPKIWMRPEVHEHGTPSLVYEVDGDIVGFVLAMTRPALLGGERIWFTTTSVLSVHPDARSTLAAVHLMRAVLDGPQDFTYVDRSNPPGRQTMRAAGMEQLPEYSMRWEKVLRPGLSLAERGAKRLPGRWSAAVPFGRRVEAALPAKVRARTVAELPVRPPGLTAEPLTIDMVVSAGPELLARFDLHPVVDDAAHVAAGWRLLDETRGAIQTVKRAYVSRRGDVIGWYVAEINERRRASVLQFAARPAHHAALLACLLHDMVELDAIGVTGDMPLDMLFDIEAIDGRVYSAQNTTSVHSNRIAVLDAFRNGRAWFSALDGELLLDPVAAAVHG